MKLGQNVYFDDRNMIVLPFFTFFWKFPDFSRFPDFSPKIAIFGQLWPKIPDRETSSTTPNVFISQLLLYIYHLVKELSLYQLLFSSY